MPDPDETTGAATAQQETTADREAERRKERARVAAQKRAAERRKAAARIRQEREDEERWEQYSLQFLRRQVTIGWLVIFLALATVFITLGVVIATSSGELGLDPRQKTLGITACAIISLITLAWAMAGPAMMRARRQLRERERAARDRAKQALEELADATSLAELLKANRKQIIAYDELARAQSKEAFRNSQIAISIGLTALVTGGLAAVVIPNTTAKITTASLTAIAGMLSGYIGKTFLRVYERTQQQLTFFFQQPLINSYVLSAERLIDAHIKDKDQEVSRIIERILAVLVQLPESWRDWTMGDGTRRGRRPAPKVMDAGVQSANGDTLPQS